MNRTNRSVWLGAVGFALFAGAGCYQGGRLATSQPGKVYPYGRWSSASPAALGHPAGAGRSLEPVGESAIRPIHTLYNDYGGGGGGGYSVGVNVGLFFPGDREDLQASTWLDIHASRGLSSALSFEVRLAFIKFEDEEDPKKDIDSTGVFAGIGHAHSVSGGRYWFSVQVGYLLNDDSDKGQDADNSLALLATGGYRWAVSPNVGVGVEGGILESEATEGTDPSSYVQLNGTFLALALDVSF